MRNVWKGLVVGGLTGVAAGIVLDLASRGSELGGAAARRSAELAPRAVDRIKSAAATGAAHVQEALHDADVRDQVLGQVNAMADKLAASDVSDQAREKLRHATNKGAELAHSVLGTAAVGGPGD
jgi:hypothetical protein